MSTLENLIHPTTVWDPGVVYAVDLQQGEIPLQSCQNFPYYFFAFARLYLRNKPVLPTTWQPSRYHVVFQGHHKPAVLGVYRVQAIRVLCHDHCVQCQESYKTLLVNPIFSL